MGFVRQLLEQRSSNFMDLLLSSRGVGLETATGKNITALSSLQSTAVFGSVRVLAEGVGSLPLILYQRQGRAKQRAMSHRLYPILHDLPNPEMTSIEFRETVMGHLALWGNGYAEIQRDRGGRPVALWPLRPDRIDIFRDAAGRLVYQVAIGNHLEHDPEYLYLDQSLVMHIKGLGYDGVRGYSPIAMARQAVGLALATEEFGARFFGNGARPGAVLEHPGKLSPEAHGRLRKSWSNRHMGLENAHRMAILEEGMKLHEVGVPPEDAQFLETRRFQTAEIARIFRVPLHMLQDLERSTNNNIEHQSLEFVMLTLHPWLVRWEQAIYRDLLSVPERSSHFAEHLVDGLLRGDIQSRYESYAVGRQNGWLSANDIREMENQNPIEGGDIYWMPVNMMPADLVASGDASAQQGGDSRGGVNAEMRALYIERRAQSIAAGRSRLFASFRRIILDATGRVVRREINDVRRAARKYFGKRDAGEFRQWLEAFYQEHREFWVRQIKPVLLSYAEEVGASVGDELSNEPRSADEIAQFIEDYVTSLAARQSQESLGQLRSLLKQAISEERDPIEAIDERLDAWEENRAEAVARDESIGAGNAFAKAFYVAAGILHLRWVARGDNCPYCRALDGRVVGIREFFLRAGEEFEPDGADRPLSRRINIGHPPLHDGCDCAILADI